jgi:hypothetical protein
MYCTVHYVVLYDSVHIIVLPQGRSGRPVGANATLNMRPKEPDGRPQEVMGMKKELKRKVAKGVLAGLLALASTVPVIAGASRNLGTTESETSRLPRTLDSLYPPAQPRPVYLFKMLDLEASFSGIVADLTEGDVEGAR